MKKKGLAGIAFWDHGERIDPNQRKSDFEYKLNEFRHCLNACELQLEAHFSNPNNNSWPKQDLYRVKGFKDFLVKNNFLSIHSRTYDCDISEIFDEGHRKWAIYETNGCIDFAFNCFADAITLHPGTYNGNIGKSWPDESFIPELFHRRSNALYSSFDKITQYFCKRAKETLKKIYNFEYKNPLIIKELKDCFKIINASSKESDYYQAMNTVFNYMEKDKVPMDIIRYCKHPENGVHMSIENVEPPNFLINTPKQHINWYNIMLDLFHKHASNMGFSQYEKEYFSPKIIVDVNHYLNSQKILMEEQNYSIHKFFDGIEDFENDFVLLPGEYENNEPVLNKIVRTFNSKTLFYHIGGANFHNNYISTHDAIKAIRKNLYMKRNFQNKMVPMYSFNNYKPDSELNLEESLQVIGPEKNLILEIHNVSHEMIRSSMIYTQEFINHLRHEEKRISNLIFDHLDSINHPNKEFIKNEIKDSKFFFKSHKDEFLDEVGYNHCGFFKYNSSLESKYEIIALQRDHDGKIKILKDE